jgi:ABC-type branched-subunit amino acid transport system ATPase component
MTHLTDFRAIRFRGLRDVRLTGLTRVNLLVGPNNCGKTSLLEAIACHANAKNIGDWLEIGRWREVKSNRISPAFSMSKMFAAFPDSDHIRASGRIALESIGERGEQSSLALFVEAIMISDEPASEDETPKIRKRVFVLGQRQGKLNENDMMALEERQGPVIGDDFAPAKIIFTTGKPTEMATTATPFDLNFEYVGIATHRTARETLDGLSRAIGGNRRDLVMGILNQVDHTLTGIEILEFADQPGDIYLRRGNEVSPLSTFGDGLRRLVHLIACAARAQDGLLLIDELEIGLHAGVMTAILPRLFALCDAFNVQVFATTHSLEAVDAFVEGLPADAEGPTLFRLPARGSEKAVRRYAWSEARQARSEYGAEVR